MTTSEIIEDLTLIQSAMVILNNLELKVEGIQASSDLLNSLSLEMNSNLSMKAAINTEMQTPIVEIQGQIDTIRANLNSRTKALKKKLEPTTL